MSSNSNKTSYVYFRNLLF